MRSTLVRVLAVTALGLLAASCTKTLDTSGLQATLKQQLEAQLGVKNLTVTCPTSLKVQAGGTFQCTVAGPGTGTLTIDVTQTDDKGNVTWKPESAATATSTPTPTP